MNSSGLVCRLDAILYFSYRCRF